MSWIALIVLGLILCLGIHPSLVKEKAIGTSLVALLIGVLLIVAGVIHGSHFVVGLFL